MIRQAVLVCAFLPLVFFGKVNATITCLGPTPYLSRDDSPFDLSGLGSTFFLDDLEDGTLNLPGFGYTNMEVRGPGSLTDSVDADDGSIDGQGNGGHSLRAIAFATLPTGPPTFRTFVDMGVGGSQLPVNAFGVAWTDAFHRSFVQMEIRSLQGDEGTCLFDGLYQPPIMDQFHSGETAEDRFIGFVSDRPILGVTFASYSSGFEPLTERLELDHVQFGVQVVPEPTQFLSVACYIVMVSAGYRLLLSKRS